MGADIMPIIDFILSFFQKPEPVIVKPKLPIINVEIEKSPIKQPKKLPTTMHDVAQSLRINYSDGNIAPERTIRNIENYIQTNISTNNDKLFHYEFHNYPQQANVTWNTKTGDCTDFSIVIETMARYLNIYGITRAHGYIYSEKGKEKHDWLIYNGKIVDGMGKAKNYEYVGTGFW